MSEWPLFNAFSHLPLWISASGAAITVAILGFTGSRLWLWTAVGLLLAYGFGTPLPWLALVAAVTLLFIIVPIRRTVFTRPLMHILRATGMLPTISETEQTAIKAGTVWLEGELFSGRPDFRRILKEPYPALTAEEQAFLDGPVEELCRVTDDWDIWVHRELPDEIWDIIRREKLFGMIIPKEYGGLGFSAMANSAVVLKLQSRCVPLATTVMVPNSLGPAELLIHYGTQEQRDYYLPRLADGSLVPPVALTEPAAGSDAGAITSDGEVFRDADGVIRLRLNWQKRYITLAAIAGVLGLAIKLRDPDNLLGKGESPGITCALIPTDTPGVILGKRHDPLGVPFVNAPTEGHNVIVPLNAIIGGADGAGQGWRMLMESLAAGRGISLPATAVGGIKVVLLAASAHATVRKQFGVSIGRFEGIEEPLARIGGWTYLMDAARKITLGAIDQGASPAVVTAMMKYNLTELGRSAIQDGMDILGGNAISGGPRNLLAHAFVSNPIGITVEGANILTRTLIIFGQGAIRCHPYAYAEIEAVGSGDLRAFDKAFWGHVGHVVRNGFRCVLLSLSRGWLARTHVGGISASYLRKLAWASASFAFMADVAMGVLGGKLKRKEKLTGRFADIFSWMYLAMATIRRFEAEGRRTEDLPFVHWAAQHALARMQQAFDGIFQNFHIPGLGWVFRGPVALWSRLNRLHAGPSDQTGHAVARLLQTPGEQRSRMAEGTYVPDDHTQALGRLEHAFLLSVQSEALTATLRKAVRAGTLPRGPLPDMVARAVAAGILTPADAALIDQAEAARWDAIQVDAFESDQYLRHHQEHARTSVQVHA